MVRVMNEVINYSLVNPRLCRWIPTSTKLPMSCLRNWKHGLKCRAKEKLVEEMCQIYNSTSPLLEVMEKKVMKLKNLTKEPLAFDNSDKIIDDLNMPGAEQLVEERYVVGISAFAAE